MIQANPNFGDAINSTVDATALALAPRRADLEREAAVTYAKAFTADELKAIADFYNSPTGKKLLKDGPIATRALYKAADIWGQGISRDLANQSNDALQKVVKVPCQSSGDRRRQQRSAGTGTGKEISAIPCRDPIRKRGFRFGIMDWTLNFKARVSLRAFLLLLEILYQCRPLSLFLQEYPMPSFDFDLFVIGGGSGGCEVRALPRRSARRSASRRKYRYGGTCVIRGCVPKKLFVYASQYSEHFEDAAGFGWTVGESTFDWKKLIEAKDKEIARLEGLYRKRSRQRQGRDLRYTRRIGRCPYDPPA